MRNREPNFTQFTGEQMKDWASKISTPVVVFFWCDWQGKCELMCSLIEKLVEEYKRVKFYWVDADEYGDICKEFSVPGVPTVLILKNGEEITRFTCPSSQEGIRHYLDDLVKAIGRPRRVVPLVPVFLW